MGTNAKGADLLVLYPSASVAQIKVRKEVCCRGKLTIPCSLQQGGYNIFQWCFGCNVVNCFKSEYVHIMTNLHLAYRQAS